MNNTIAFFYKLSEILEYFHRIETLNISFSSSQKIEIQENGKKIFESSK